jgi:hypothetical protein
VWETFFGLVLLFGVFFGVCLWVVVGWLMLVLVVWLCFVVGCGRFLFLVVEGFGCWKCF